jgi:uncharacterized protein with ParB-like and HNH nuclease domain
VWSREYQWEPLWEDVVSQVRVRLDGRTPKPHYCGAIVIDEKKKNFVTDTSRFNVIDGQQRLTTFQIILAALRDVCIKHEAKPLIAKFGKMIFNESAHHDETTHENTVKLRPTKYDRASFFDVLLSADREKIRQKYYVAYKPNSSGKKAQKVSDLPNSVAAYLFFYDAISHLVSEPKDTFGTDSYSPDEILNALSGAILADFHTVIIMLDESDDAQVIFESLNYRGQPLLASDLIRNFAFLRAEQNGENIEQIYADEWSVFEDKFWTAEDRQGRIVKPRMEFFFANFLASNTGSEINQSRIYQEYLEWIEYRKHDLNVKYELRFIAKYADLYKTLVAPSGDSDLANSARFLSAFDVTIAFPLIMAIFADGDIDLDQKSEMLSDFESYMVRRAICGRTPKGYNKIFLHAIRELRAKAINPANLRQFLRSQKGESSDWPADDEFKVAFMRNPLYKSLSPARLVYILTKIELSSISKFSEGIKLTSELSVEHIMPQTWYGIWPIKDGRQVNAEQIENAKRLEMLGLPMDAFSKEIVGREDLINTVGNLTLITGRLNSSVSNGLFSEKRGKILQHSVLALNRYFHQVDQWDEEMIIQRAEVLFDAAQKVWPRPSADM